MPPVAIIHIFARIFEVQLGGHGGNKRGKIELQNDSTENHNQTEPCWDRKNDIFDLKCFVSISRSVVPVWARSTFSKKS